MELFYKWISMEGKSISSLSISFVGAVKDNKIFKNIAYIPLLKCLTVRETDDSTGGRSTLLPGADSMHSAPAHTSCSAQAP